MTATASQQFQRAVVDQPFTLEYTFGLDGETLPDADSITLAVADSEGNAVTTSGLAQGTASNGQQTATADIAAGALTQRDLLTATWSYTVNSADVSTTSTIDVCDKRLFPLSDFDQFNDAAITGATSDEKEKARREAENYLERECGCAFTGRYGTEDWQIPERFPHDYAFGYETGYGFGASWQPGVRYILLRQPAVLKLRSLTRTYLDTDADPVATATHTLNTLYYRVDPHTSRLTEIARDPSDQYRGLWGDLTIAYEYGLLHEPDVRRVCLILARYRLIQGPFERRAASMDVEGGGRLNFIVPGVGNSVTGIPEVDLFIGRYSQRATGFFGR